MSDQGVIGGLVPGTWHTYRPRMFTAGNGGEVQPVLDDVGDVKYQFGRYNLIDKSLVVCEFQTQFIGAFSIGSGSAYVFELPFPAKRWSGYGSEARIPIGSGMCYLSFYNAPNPALNIPVIPTLADPFPSLGGGENRFFQAYAPYIYDSGTFTFKNAGSGGTTTQTFTHDAKFAFASRDIEIVCGITSGNTWWPLAVNNITSTTFDLVSPQGTPNVNVTGSYKIRAEPPTGQFGALVSPIVPFDWARAMTLSPFGNFFFHLIYEAA